MPTQVTKHFVNNKSSKYSNFNNHNRLKLELKLPSRSIALLFLLSLNFLLLVHLINAQMAANNEDEMAFTYKERAANPDEYAYAKSTKRGPARQTRTTSTKHASKQVAASVTIKQTTSAKLGSKLTSQMLSLTNTPMSPPFTYATETLNQTHANMFKNWLDSKSVDLYELSMNFSGFKLLNETYNIQLRKDAKFAWINFTEMIINISSTISEVLYNKTLIVKNLTEVVERAFDEYRNDTGRVKESAKFVYYDAKSPKTFCDVQEASNARKANQSAMVAAAHIQTTTSTTTKQVKAKIGDTTKAGTGKQATAAGSSKNASTDKATSQKPIFAAPSLPAEAKSNSKNKRSHIKNFDEFDNEDFVVENKKDNVLDSLFVYQRTTTSTSTNHGGETLDSEFLDEIEFDTASAKFESEDQNTPSEREEEYDDDDEDRKCSYSSFLVNYKNHSNNNNVHSVNDHYRGFESKPLKSKRSPQGGGGNVNPNRYGSGKGRSTGGPGTVSKSPGSGVISGGKLPGPGAGTAAPGGKGKGTKFVNGSRMSTVRTTPSTSTSGLGLIDDSEERNDGESYDDYMVDFELSYDKSPYWNITCINRTFDENFKNFQKGVNRNVSTIHVPTNVYKQDIIVNMTAYWTEALDDQFRKNYDSDNELFWQYFCSSQGLFRRYPGAYWTVPQHEDFFDCRLQSWYIMAAASPKDVLILLDISGSMTGVRFGIAKKLIEAILDTLSDNDFFNVLVFSKTVDYLMNMPNETMYRDRFIQAGKTNKQTFIKRLKWFYNTSEVANYHDALKMSFSLLLNDSLESESCGCNKVIMVITDGASENAEDVFRKYNWENGRKVRVFTFLIGRDQTDHRQVEWMACANDGRFFHVATIADVNEHVHEYIPVIIRPMALNGHHETTWSNVFVGHLDKELKIAVARPAFKTRDSLLSRVDLEKRPEDYFKVLVEELKTTTQAPMVTDYPTYGEGPVYDDEYDNDIQNYDEYGNTEGGGDERLRILIKRRSGNRDGVGEISVAAETSSSTSATASTTRPPITEKRETDEEIEHLLMKTDEEIKKQQVLLGVVGVDVPVLRLISKVSPKYQMGVGIYIIMLDNNGFIVFHPSIRKEIANTEGNYKGTSSSIDLDRFEIPIDNVDAFEALEHDMIDQKTNNVTLDNWKREGLRIIRRRTEYVYTPVDKTPFSVAIASPSSFGRFYIDLPSSKEKDYESQIRELMKNRYEANIQLYNCTYNYTRISEKILNPRLYTDYCIKYLFQDTDQVLAIKSDLVFHDIYYNMYNFSIFSNYPNLVKSSFYGTYSGITFYLPVTFYKIKPGMTFGHQFKTTLGPSTPNGHTSVKTTTTSTTPTTSEQTTPDEFEITDPPSEMTINVEMGSIVEPLLKISTKPTVVSPNNRTGNGSMLLDAGLQSSNESDVYKLSLNLFSTENNKHTYSFEKQYYTRSIEFSDYLRTEFNLTSPVVVYFLNESSSSKESRRDTVSATIPIWLDKVPTAVTGVVYDATLLQYYLFENFIQPNCNHSTCRNPCSMKREMNITCYLVDEHGIVVMSTMERLSKQTKEPIMGQPLYKVNPWLMKILEFEGVYNLAIPGSDLPECKQLPRTINSAASIKHIFKFITGFIGHCFKYFYDFMVYFLVRQYMFSSSDPSVYAQSAANPQLTLADRIKMFNNEWRVKNSHCYYFGVYSFNLTKWKELDASEVRVWCNSTYNQQMIQRKFLTGYVRHSNLIMLIVEEEFELIHCGNISQLIRIYKGIKSDNNSFNETGESINGTNFVTTPTSLASTSSEPSPYSIQETNMVDMLENSILKISDDIEFIDYEENNSNESSMTIYKKEKINDFTINRYRKKPAACNNFYENEKFFLPCKNSAFRFKAGLASYVLILNWILFLRN